MDLVGRKVGPYEVRAHIGRGGVADVYRAVHTELAKEVALKVLFEESSEDRDQIARFQRESRVLARLSHSGIVQVYDCGNEGALHYFAMVLLEHRTLGALLEIHAPAGGWLPEPQCLSIVSSILEVLAVVHGENIIHRDIKPSNIFVTAEDQAIVSDFGLVKVIDETSLTASPDMMLGTIQYMAPEQILSEPPDARTDLYAVGLLLYRMLYGKLPFGDQMAEVVQKKTLHAGFKPPAQPPREVSPGLADVLVKACRRDRRERFASAVEFANALERLSLGVRPISQPLPQLSKVGAKRATQLSRIAPAGTAALGGTAVARRRPGWVTAVRALMISALALGASIVVGLAVRLAQPGARTLPGWALAGSPASPSPGPSGVLFPVPPDVRLLAEAQDLCRDVQTVLASECYKVFLSSVLAPDVERLRACYDEELAKIATLEKRLGVVIATLERSATTESSLAGSSWLGSATLNQFLLGCRKRGVTTMRDKLANLKTGQLSQDEIAHMQPLMSVDASSPAQLQRHGELVRELCARMAQAPDRVEAEAGRLVEDVRQLARLVGLLTWTPEGANAVRDHLRLIPELSSRAPGPVGPALATALTSVRTVALHSGRGELTRAMVRASIEDLAGLRALLPASHAGFASLFTEAWRDLDRARPQ